MYLVSFSVTESWSEWIIGLSLYRVLYVTIFIISIPGNFRDFPLAGGVGR